MDPLRHPDLVDVSRRMRAQLDNLLEAEQEAATVAARRRATLRDRLLEAEDRAQRVVVACLDGGARQGRVAAVGSDHVVLVDSQHEALVALSHIVELAFCQ